MVFFLVFREYWMFFSRILVVFYLFENLLNKVVVLLCVNSNLGGGGFWLEEIVFKMMWVDL